MRIILAAAAMLAAAGLARANDTTANLAAGGLTIEKNDQIELRVEDLFLSRKEVRVRYVFFNAGPADLTLRVAFAMPDIEGSGDFNVDVPDDTSANFLKFSTKVDGRPVEPQVEQRAFLKPENGAEKEITGELRALGVPLLPTGAAADALRKIPEDRLKPLVDAGSVIVSEIDAGKGMEKDFQPVWILRSYFHRQQTFPAGRETIVEHRYQPSVGSTVTVLASPKSAPEDLRRYRRDYCADEDFLRSAGAIAKRQESGPRKGQPYFYETWFSYVLTTGGNWKGPIGQFRLVVDKGRAGNLVSFCGAGVNKTSPTRFEMKATNFTPKQEINVLLLDASANP